MLDYVSRDYGRDKKADYEAERRLQHAGDSAAVGEHGHSAETENYICRDAQPRAPRAEEHSREQNKFELQCYRYHRQGYLYECAEDYKGARESADCGGHRPAL